MDILYRKMAIIVIIALLIGSTITSVIGIEGEKVACSSSSFQLLIKHKSQYMNATIFILEDILKNSSFWVNGTYGDATNMSDGNLFVEDGKEVTANFSRFNDTAAIIRNFIRYSYQEMGTKYVLLGGDVETIPVRKLYVYLSDWQSVLLGEVPIEGWIPSDLYFGCLNGTWNDDFDTKFGEQKEDSIGEEADFIAEVYIGRAPVDNKYDVATFANKVIHFETTEKPKDILLHQSNLVPKDGPETSVISEECANWITNDYIIHRLYQKNDKISVVDWIRSFSTPEKLVVLHVGNGYYSSFTDSWYQLYLDNYFGRVTFTPSDIYKLRNTFFPIHISISCLTGNFCDSDCLAEELLFWPQGGPSACFFNSEVGCVDINDASKYFAEFIEGIFYELFENDTKNLGKINLFSKYPFINLAQTNPTYRWCYFEINLLGDPETPVTETRNKLSLFSVFVDDDFDEFTPDWNITRFNNIQDAINSVPENGVVNVNSGIYREGIVIDKTIKLIGEDKNTTIIECSDSEIVINAKTNSSLIKNFTICHNTTTQKIQNQTGIYVPPNCWGNVISYNIITNNSKCGIIVHDTCRTFIHNNTIQFNGEGVCIVNQLHSNFSVITCHNMIRYNKIVSNENYGIYLEGALHSEIINNNIMNNGGYRGKLSSNNDAFFKISRWTNWDGNYWGEPCSEKYILGTRGPIFFWLPDFSGGGNIFSKLLNYIMFKPKNYWDIYNIGILSYDIDENPAQEPYDIC